jgi:hypothetical protein
MQPFQHLFHLEFIKSQTLRFKPKQYRETT